jgi:hypothetical protein
VPTSLSDALSHIIAAKLGILEAPPNYRDGSYSTIFTKTTTTEDKIIYHEKNKRHDTVLVEIVCSLYKQKTGEDHNMNEEELTKWSETSLLDIPPLKPDEMRTRLYIDIRYFSEYIPSLGFNAEVLFLHNTPEENLFMVLMSSYPPGSLYKKDTEA